jgi:hypothetical protein
MRWFRSNIRAGSRLALLALAIQIVVAFGHVHLYGFGRASAKAGAPADVFAAVAPNPRDSLPNSGGPADPDCPICALIQSASTSPPSLAPALLLPLTFIPLRREAKSELAKAASPHFLFQARAPPSI